jgi:hypothetical protein
MTALAGRRSLEEGGRGVGRELGRREERRWGGGWAGEEREPGQNRAVTTKCGNMEVFDD